MREARRHKTVIFALGAVGLAAALTLAAVAAPSRAATRATPFTPTDPDAVLARVPVRDPGELAARRALAASPESLELALDLARADLARARSTSDPRYLGRAQAALGRWWSSADVPADVLLLRATIRQALHEFGPARADLDALIAQRPDDVQAHLTRAVVATVTADYAAARESCTALAARSQPVIAAACAAPLDALSGRADAAYDALASALAGARGSAPSVRAWALTTLGELAVQRDDRAAAERHFRAVLQLDPNDSYALGALADVLLQARDYTSVSALLADHDAIDGLLLRRAIAEHAAGGPLATRLVADMRERIADAAVRGDRIHLREEARFALAVEARPERAVRLARENWDVQKELADARLLVEAAVADRDPDAAQPVITWARTLGVRDAQLTDAIRRLEELP